MKKLWILVLLLVLSRSAAATPPSLPFIEDDYAKALATAKQRKLPIFVEVSAPW
jgi:hypothetical protein